jgi:glycosyltransferase involved in cell wall biosynthesis
MVKRVLLVNKFYYNRGGDCIHTLNIESLLKEKGIDVAVFSMAYPENFDSEYKRYFAPQIDFNGNLESKIKAMRRVLGYGNVITSFEKILNDFNPDVVHLQNIHSYISPIVGEIAKQRGCRVVWTLHDYKLLCPAYTCTFKGKPCELCFTNKCNVVKRRCMKGNIASSLIAYWEAMKWNRGRLEKMTDAFICPSHFMADKMLKGGFDENKLHVVSNFIDPIKIKQIDDMGICTKREDYYVYVGRLSQEKGIITLLDVAAALPYKLKVVGTGPLSDKIKENFGTYRNIEFLGQLNAEEVVDVVAKAKCLVIPSEWYENNPLSVIEALCTGTPVIGANIGGIPELITERENGITFESSDVNDLNSKIRAMWNYSFDYTTIAEAAQQRYNAEKYYEEITRIYTSN